MTAPPPAGSLTHWWCSACGRQEAQRQAWHVRLSSLGERCPGDMRPVEYRLDDSLPGIAEAR